MLHHFALTTLAILVLASELSARGGPVQLAPDASWCWFGNPRAMFKNGLLHFGYVRQEDGRVALSCYSPASGTGSVLWVSEMNERDDHNNPGLADLPDGRLMAVYAKHGSERRFYYRLSTPAREGAAANWGPELIFTNTANGVTYANPYLLRAENGRIYNFMRNLNHNPTFIYSDASATNWSAPRILIRSGNGRSRPYVQYCSNGEGRIDLVYTDGHPLAVQNSLYHVFYENGALYSSDGRLLKYLTNAPLEHDLGERGTVIYRHDSGPAQSPHDHLPGARAWCWDLAYDAAGLPVTVFSVQRTNVMGADWDGDRIYYYYARWTGAKWKKRFLAHAGRPLYAAERDYAGGITVDPRDPGIVYLSSNAARPFQTSDIDRVPLNKAARYEIFRGVTSDGGLTFHWQAVTVDSTVDNLRPYVPRQNLFPCGLTWIAGRYESYTSWRTALYGLFTTNLVPVSMRPSS